MLDLMYYNFYSHAPRGARLTDEANSAIEESFLLTRPSRGATFEDRLWVAYLEDFYSHAPRGARR